MATLTVPVIEGDGIRLRPFTSADTAPIIAAGNDPLIPWITTVESGGDHAAAREFIDRQHGRARDGEGYSFAIADIDTDEAIGQIGVWPTEPRHGRSRIGYWVSPDHRRRGVMTRALRLATEFALALDDSVRTELYIEPWNTGSRRTATNAGYLCEGLVRDAQRVAGEPRDMFLYARTGSDTVAGEAHSTAEFVTGECTIDDVAELLVLQRCCWVAEAIANDTLDIPPLHETVDDVRAWVMGWMVLTVRDHGRLVGAVRGRLVGQTWEIGRLMVAPDKAGRGLGRRLLGQAERLAPSEARVFELFTGARSARNVDLYQRAGYRIVDSITVPDGHIAGAVILRKPTGA